MPMARGSSDAPLTDCLLGQFFSRWEVMMARRKLSVGVACPPVLTGGNVPPPFYFIFSFPFFVVLHGNAHVEHLPLVCACVCVCLWLGVMGLFSEGGKPRGPLALFSGSPCLSAQQQLLGACGSKRISASAKNPEGVAQGGGKSSGWDGVVSHCGLAPVYVGIFFSFHFFFCR